MNTVSQSVGATSELEALWRGPIPETERLLFLKLSREKQRLAIARLTAMNEFQDGKPAATLFPKLGIGKARFYKIVKTWVDQKSLAALVPFATEQSKQKSPRLNEEVKKLLLTTIKENAKSGNAMTERQLVEKVRGRAAKQSLPMPSAETVSRHLVKTTYENAEVSLAPVTRGSTTNPGDIFAAHLIIDHVTADLIVRHEGQLLKPTLTLVVDDATRIILGSNLAASYPAPGSVSAAMLGAAERYRQLAKDGIGAVPGLRPLISARFPVADTWSEVDWLLQDSGFKSWNVSRSPSEHHKGYGRLLRRFMVTKLGEMGLLTAATWMEPSKRVSKQEATGFSGMSWEDALSIVAEGIARHNKGRLTVARQLSRTLPSDLKSYRLGPDRSKDYVADAFNTFDQLLKSASAVAE